MFIIEKYKTLSGRCPLDDFLNEIKKSGNNNELFKIQDYVIKLEELGNQILTNSNWAKAIGNGIYELRPNKNRIVYFYCSDNGHYVLLHGFKKKTNKTPPNEIEQAIKEATDYERRYKNGK
ncbi:MAG: type II toxin-antitoxin system RelE/ParE family toxin [Acholeplasmatales bacterium]|nr:type II toxin-antitoxin system RelE/ParE family toxin [Acholeplasmatales bacterium]